MANKSKQRDITPPWAIGNGFLLAAVAYLLACALVIYLSWRWACLPAHQWPGSPKSWVAWVVRSWTMRPEQLAAGHEWLTAGRAVAALAVLLPIPLAAWAGWWIAKPGPHLIHLAGRRISTDAREARREAAKECRISGQGLPIHPQIPLSLDRETRHIFCCGGTGGGKTVMMLPLIRHALCRGDKVLLNDSKNEFVEILEDAPDADDFVTLSPWDQRCHAWHIAADVTNKADARTIASRLVPESDKDPMWGLAAQSILVAVFCKHQHEKPEQWDLQDVLTDIFSGYDHLRATVMQYNREGLYAVEDAQKTKTTQSFLITLSTFLSQVSDLAEAWKNKPKISLRRWLLDPESAEYQSPEFRYIMMGGNKRYLKLEQAYTQSIIAAMSSIINSPEMPDSSTRRIWLFLDECPQLGEITELSQFFEIGRSKGCRVVVGTQDIAQLRNIYGKETTEAWTSMAGTYLIGRTGGAATQKWLSELIGTKKVKKYRISYTRDPGASDQASGRQDMWEDIEEPVVRPEEFSTTLGRRKNGMECLYVPGGDVVYRLIWPFSSKAKIRPVLVPAAWTQGPRLRSPPTVSADVGGPAIQPLTPEKQPAVLADEQQQEQPAPPESPIEKIAEDLAEQAAEQIADAALPGAGAAVAAAEMVAKTAEIIDPAPQPAAPTPPKEVISKPKPERPEPGNVWLDEETEEELW